MYMIDWFIEVMYSNQNDRNQYTPEIAGNFPNFDRTVGPVNDSCEYVLLSIVIDVENLHVVKLTTLFEDDADDLSCDLKYISKMFFSGIIARNTIHKRYVTSIWPAKSIIPQSMLVLGGCA
jgi:hypothetical protein